MDICIPKLIIVFSQDKYLSSILLLFFSDKGVSLKNILYNIVSEIVSIIMIYIYIYIYIYIFIYIYIYIYIYIGKLYSILL